MLITPATVCSNSYTCQQPLFVLATTVYASIESFKFIAGPKNIDYLCLLLCTATIICASNRYLRQQPLSMQANRYRCQHGFNHIHSWSKRCRFNYMIKLLCRHSNLFCQQAKVSYAVGIQASGDIFGKSGVYILSSLLSGIPDCESWHSYMYLYLCLGDSLLDLKQGILEELSEQRYQCQVT